MPHRAVLHIALFCLGAALAHGAAPHGHGYILTPPEFRLYLGSVFPVAGVLYRYSGFENTPQVKLHTDRGRFSSSNTAEASSNAGSDLLILDDLPMDYAGAVELWLTADDREITRVSVPVVRPVFTSAVRVDKTDTVRYTLHDQAHRPISGAPVLMRLKIEGLTGYAAAAQTDADGAATFAIPFDRFAGNARIEFHCYRAPILAIDVQGHADKTSIPADDDPVGVYSTPARLQANWCGEFPLLVTAITRANAQLPDTAQVNTYGATKFALSDGVGVTTIPFDLYHFESMPCGVLLYSGAAWKKIPQEKTLEVVTRHPDKMQVRSHLELQKGAPAQLIVTLTNANGIPLDGIPVAINFTNLPYQVYRTDGAGSLRVPIPPMKTIGIKMRDRQFAYFHIDTYAYHDFINMSFDDKWRITSLERPGANGQRVILESVTYDKAGQPTVTRQE